MQQTSNFGLQKPEPLIDNVDVNVLNGNMDKVDNLLGSTVKYEKATGTATVITLTLPSLVDGLSKNFICTYSNNGAATTINTKPLYKPGTITAPTLVSGKAYTVWYDATGGCFFIKASAEGNAATNNVLAGKTFSNDNDTGLLGTLDLANLVSGNIRAGVSINSIVGKASVVDTADATAIASDILDTKTAHINGVKVNGSMLNYKNKAYPTEVAAYTISRAPIIRGATPTVSDWYFKLNAYNACIDITTECSLGLTNLIPSNIKEGVYIGGHMIGTAPSGKKFASGSVLNANTSPRNYDIDITSLSFRPSSVVLIEKAPSNDYYHVHFMSSIAYDMMESLYAQGSQFGPKLLYRLSTGTCAWTDGGLFRYTLKSNGFFIGKAFLNAFVTESTWYAWE